jgi:ParB family chromosome partitioning protein
MNKRAENSAVIKIEEVKVHQRFRSDLGDLTSLKESIHRLGLLQPIGITKDHVLVYGHRRLEAAKLLKWTEIPYIFVDTDEVTQPLAELEENLRRKDMTWQEEVTAKAKLHRLFRKRHGRPKAGYRSDVKVPLSDSEKGWGLKNTAKYLGESIGSVSQDLKLAKALKTHPPLWKEPKKSNALRYLKKVKQPDNVTDKAWTCDICGKEHLDKHDKHKMKLCATCSIEIKPFTEFRLPKGMKKPKKTKYAFKKLMKDGRLRI